MMEVFDLPQKSEEWFAARRGVPTASNFATILASGDGRRTLLYKLAGERKTEETATSFTNDAMERGNEMEAEARSWYALTQNVEPALIGFIKNGKCGGSPDALIGADGILEIKTAEPHILIPMLESGKFPNKHYAQCQGNLMVSERQWCDLLVYWPKMPKLLVRCERDEMYIDALRDAIDVFDLDLRRLVTKLKTM